MSTNSFLEVGMVPTNSLLGVGTVPTNSNILTLFLSQICTKRKKSGSNTSAGAGSYTVTDLTWFNNPASRRTRT